MTAALPFAAELALRATLLIGAAWAAAFLLRKAGASAAARHMAWLLGIAALLALPPLWWLAPPLPLPILRAESAGIAAGAIAEAFAPPAGVAARAAGGAALGMPGWGGMLLAFYLIGAAAMLLRFAMSRRLVARLWREAEPARDADWQNLLARVSREMRIARPVALRIARGPAMPMTWGTLSPRILLPAEARAWPAERRRLVLLHELAHVARGDSLSRSAASLACALYWFHPGAWFAAGRMRLEQEYAADDRVLKAGAGPRSYALSLLELARRASESRRPDHAAAMAGICQLERRVVSITGEAHRERPGPAFLSGSAAIAILVMLMVAAAVPVRPLPALPDPIGSGSGLEPSPPALRAAPAPDEGGAGPEAPTADRAAMLPAADGFSGTFGAARAAAAPQASEAGAQAAAGEAIAPAAQGEAAAQSGGAASARDGQSAAPSVATPQPPRVYGPPLPRPIAEEQPSDPRIPAALRRRNDSRSADAGSASRRGRPFPFQFRDGGVELVFGNGRARP